MNEFEGRLSGKEAKVAIVVSRYNESITRRLLDGALETLKHHGVDDKDIDVVWVPGAFEIPVIAHKLANAGHHAAVCCLGAVITGDTTHDQYINQQVARALMEAGTHTGIPVIFGVLTCQNMQQAMDRAGGKVGNKGSEAATTALQMIDVLKQIDAVQI